MSDRKKLKARNLKAFLRWAPPLHEMLLGHKPSSELVFDKDGEPDIVFNGKAVYGGKAKAFADDQVREFLKKPRRFVVAPVQPGQRDQVANRFLGAVLEQAKKDGVTFGPSHRTPNAYFLAVLGIGLGLHIDALVECTDCQVLIIAEQHLEGLYHSLEVYDWHRLFKGIDGKGGQVFFIINNEPAKISGGMRTIMQMANPSSADGITCFTHDASPQFTLAMEIFAQEMELIFTGLGFFYDETLMIRNSYGNLVSGDARLYQRPERPLTEIPAFIIATGPSLDDSISYLKANADKAIIISSGTAIRPLLVNGIVPDFHIETENINVFPYIDQVAKDFDLSSICLLASSTVDLGVNQFFDTIVYYFRGSLSAAPLFCQSESNCFLQPEPTVVNASLSFAIEAGCKENYLFGVDMGAKVASNHHSKDSTHFMPDNVALEDDLVFNHQVPGNFGGTCWTSTGFIAARESLSVAMQLFGEGQRFYNCSDGALIDGAEPLPAQALTLPDVEGGKEAVVRGIVDSFPIYSRQEFEKSWDLKKIIAAINSFIDNFIACVEGTKTFLDKRYLTDLMNLLSPTMDWTENPSKGIENAVLVLFRGSLFTILMDMEYYFNRITDVEKAAAIEHILRRELLNTAHGLREKAIEVLSDPANVPSQESNGEPIPDELIPELPYTWGDVARNAPCPCGSGKRYKHCHG
ncbi:MAG: DUF115 domain-containing protein [Rhodospirillales bacterium]|nr:DUF115 domain-containing protein [Rhodospirillales bacterium]